MKWLTVLQEFNNLLLQRSKIEHSVLTEMCVEQIIQGSVILYALSLEKQGKIDTFDEQKDTFQKKVFAYLDDIKVV